MGFILRSLLHSLAWLGVQRWIRQQFPTVPQLSPTELANWLQQTDRELPLLLDVRTAAEYNVSHLPQAQLSPSAPQWLNTDPLVTSTTPIVVYCSIGYRSSRFAEKLQAMGYQQVFNLEGSIFQWANQGRTLYQGDRIVTQVHPYNPFWGVLLTRNS